MMMRQGAHTASTNVQVYHPNPVQINVHKTRGPLSQKCPFRACCPNATHRPTDFVSDFAPRRQSSISETHLPKVRAPLVKMTTDVSPILSSPPPTMQCLITPLEAPGQFLLSDCTDANFLKQAPEGQMIWRNDPNYEILELLGCGVYGTVCRGRNLATGRVVAIKRIFMAQVCMGEFALLVTVGSFMFLCRVHGPRTPRNVCAYCVS